MYGICKLVASCNPYLIFVLNQLADVVASLDHELYRKSGDKVAGTAHDKIMKMYIPFSLVLNFLHNS